MASRPLPPDFAGRIKKGVAKVAKERVPNALDVAEQIDLGIQKEIASLANEYLLIDLREMYGNNIVVFLWVYFIFAVVMVGGAGIGLFNLPAIVLAAIIGGTAVSVIGVVGTVAAGLFRAPPRD